ncbi:hypothetical protein [Bradyrhizobium elkanii]|uniref:hypothetical protein n=1 Tax=Bradyrhizobium elkanii TaxID=29448 RepID=UPI00101FF92B|nr:hypothetical protein [Bradyrhizobium elkanii]NWL43824.1 hypothetical protein [Bradyrhizobium elkanii]RYM19359.1 hypothetical protein EWH13_28785 [Bradyrhizobium elkanii]WLA52331.1 hypothetical protein QIH80_20915 [Bradyrhizobium elkanii]WLB77320.1 hypothetical protein QIH83_23280 [Bradyrhizobium elkanii]
MDGSTKAIVALSYVAGILSAVIALMLFVGLAPLHSKTGAPGIALWSGGPKCDDPSTIRTVKELANDKLNSVSVYARDFLLRSGGSSADMETVHKMQLARTPLNLDADSFRERGTIGKGVTCAAVLYVMLGGSRTFEFSSEYSVEPTSDGKTIVSAKFMPNG